MRTRMRVAEGRGCQSRARMPALLWQSRWIWGREVGGFRAGIPEI
jgi:hypothetical protein